MPFRSKPYETNIQSCIKNNEELKLFSFYVPEDSQKVREIYSLDKLQLRLKIEKFHFERTRVSSILHDKEGKNDREHFPYKSLYRMDERRAAQQTHAVWMNGGRTKKWIGDLQSH